MKYSTMSGSHYAIEDEVGAITPSRYLGSFTVSSVVTKSLFMKSEGLSIKNTFLIKNIY